MIKYSLYGVNKSKKSMIILEEAFGGPPVDKDITALA